MIAHINAGVIVSHPSLVISVILYLHFNIYQLSPCILSQDIENNRMVFNVPDRILCLHLSFAIPDSSRIRQEPFFSCHIGVLC